MEELVSIITPLYNAASTIRETIDSVINQTYNNWEMIIVDDCSKDNSAEIVEEYCKLDKRIVLVRSPSNGGTAVSRNIATEKARGRFIAFLDADDMWKPNKLELQIKFMTTNGYSFCYSNYDIKKENGDVALFRPKKEFLSYKNLLKRNDIGCLTVIYDCSKIGKVYMPLDAPKREEYAAWLDCTKKGVIPFKIDESLAVYRLGSSTLTSNKLNMIKYHYRVYRNHEKFGPIRSAYYVFLFSLNKYFGKYH